MKSNLLREMDLTPLWSALADSKRRRIIQLLAEKTRTTSEISAYFDVSRFAIMRHLKVLERAGLIKTRREGRLRWNMLNHDMFQQIQRTFLDNGTDGEYQLNDILAFLVRQEGTRVDDSGVPEQLPVEMEVTLHAPPDRVFRALTDEIDAWWSYRIVTDSVIHLELEVGGRFYEEFNDGGGAQYALVTYLKPNEEIRLTGSMGMADQASSNLVSLALQPLPADTTRLQLTHHFLGRVSVVTVDTFKLSWVELLSHHLKAHIEQEIPIPASR